MALLPVFILAAQILFLAIFSFFAFFNYLYGIASLWRPRIPKILHSGRRIAVVIVSFNEKFVIEETVRACDDLTYPNKIIVLADDSDDPEVVEKRRRLAAARGCRKVDAAEHGIFQEIIKEDGSCAKLPIELWESSDFVYFRRPVNIGFKSGSLRQLHEYLKRLDIRLMYLLDADWHPQHDALERCLEVMEAQDKIAFVQTKRIAFSHGMNLLQKYVSLNEEGCYYVDQEGRQVIGHPILFSGCCALLSLEAIELVGGFTPGHLTEDIDLTNRFWLNGWKGIYLGAVVNHGEVPFAYDHFRRQQERWVAGTARALKDYFWPLIKTRRLSWFQKISAIRQNAYYTTTLFTMLALFLGVATIFWVYACWNTYPVEYYLFQISKVKTPLVLLIYFCLLSNILESFIMIVVKKRTYMDLLHLPMFVWYTWSVLPTCVIGNLKGFLGVRMSWFCTPKFLRGNSGSITRVPYTVKFVNYFVCLIVMLSYFIQSSVFGWVDIFIFLWIPAFLIASME